MNQDTFMEPPLYFAQDHIFDIDFHAAQDVLACSLITGHVKLLSYTQDDVREIASFDHHKQSSRISRFSPSGLSLLTASKDGSFGLLDQNGKLLIHQLKAHKDGINAALFLNEKLLALGDDDGRVKVWDLRSSECVYQVKEVEESISAFAIDSAKNLLLSTSLDGYLTVHDLRVNCTAKTSCYARSDCLEEDLTDICLVKGGAFACVSTSEGNLLLFKWDHFGDFKDRIVGHPNSIDTLLKVDENTIMTGGEDGLLRGVGVFPNQIVGVLGQHEENQQFPISKIAMDHTKRIVASISHDNSIKFHDVIEFMGKRAGVHDVPQEFEQIEKVQKEEMSEEEDDDDDEDSDDSDDKPKQQSRSNRVKNVKHSTKTLKRDKLKQFYQNL